METLGDVLRTYRSDSPATTRSKLTRTDSFDEDKTLDLLRLCYIRTVTKRGLDCHLDKDIEEKMERVVNWLSTCRKPGLLLYGNLGTGKTTMLKALRLLFLKYRRFGDGVLLESAAGIVDAYCRHKANDYSFPGVNYGDVLRSDPLFVDELGGEPACKVFGTDYEPMCELLCRRYERGQITVLTSNLGDEQIRQIYGMRLWERIYESYYTITFEGKNFRTINEQYYGK